jgi:GT2 family glycosyltransferase
LNKGKTLHIKNMKNSLPKVGIVLMNYNLPIETDYVYEKLQKSLTRTNFRICVLDNASDKASPSKYTNLRSIVNTRTMGAILLGAHHFNRQHDIKYVFYIHNDMDFDENVDILEHLVEFMEKNENVAVIHPAIDPAGAAVPIGDQIVVHNPDNKDGFRKVMPNLNDVITMDDTSPILVRKSDWNLVGGQDPRLTRCYGAGRDFYTQLHKAGKEIYICDQIPIIHKGQYTYTKNVGDEPYQILDRSAYQEMFFVMSEKYGPMWRQIFM